MTKPNTTPPVSDLKDQAKRLRQALANQGTTVSHAQSLELLAQQFGLRDWNTLSARAGTAIQALPQVGETVRGRYMGQPFSGTLKALSALSGQKAWRVSIQLDQPIDVVSFDSFQALRHRISGTVGADGRSVAHRSDGTPHLVLDWAHG